ncbi:MAG: TIR domain-containing protein [Verrucomicrobia bacterium]|nr:TIR domain-containing protein [Verrucomicrobiota bacterium]
MPAPSSSGAVFLSYAREDMDAARRIADALRSQGVEVWFDQSELRGGDAWDAKIRKQIRECALFVPIISATTEAREKGYFRREWKLAVDCTRDLADDVPFMVPVAIDGTAEANARVPEKFQEIQWARLPDGHATAEFSAHVNRLLEARGAGPHSPAGETKPEPDVGKAVPNEGSKAITERPTIVIEDRPDATIARRQILPAATVRSGRRALPRVVAVFAGLVVAAVAGWFGRALLPSQASSDLPTMWLEVGPPHRSFGFQPAPSISPDGSQIAFWAPDENGKIGLWIRSLNSPVARVLPGTNKTDEWSLPACWSPDGRSLGFFADRKLKRIDVAGGTALTLAEAPNPRGASWSKDGVIIFVPASFKPVHRIPASGGQATALTIVSPLKYEYYAWPHVLPDGKQFFVTASLKGRSHVLIASLAGTGAPLLSKIESRFEFADGHVFFGQRGSLFAQRFDEQTLTLAGEPFRVAENLGLTFGDLSAYAFSVSRQGTVIHWSGSIVPVTQLTWFSRAGQRLGTLGDPGEYLGFAVAPNFQQAVLERHDPKVNEVDLWLVDATTNVGSKFSSGLDDHGSWNVGTPVWSPAGDRVLFATFPGLAAQSLRGGEAEKLFDGLGWLGDLSPDGQYALMWTFSPETAGDLWVLPLKGDKTLKPFIVTKASEGDGRFSPDGRWVAYVSDESGRYEIYVQSFPEPGRAVRISREGGERPEWRSDGKELYYLAPDHRLMAAAVEGGGSPFQVSSTQSLFSVNTGTDFGRQQYQASGDGERFLINAVVEDTTPRRMTVILNWKGPGKK